MTWEKIGQVQPGDKVPFSGNVPAMRDEPVTDLRTVRSVVSDGRARILTFEDGSTFDAGHAYRLFVERHQSL